jgi:hypothetical protein
VKGNRSSLKTCNPLTEVIVSSRRMKLLLSKREDIKSCSVKTKI